jgi:DNA-binding winged helix-turn-helix (wHTH) protein
MGSNPWPAGESAVVVQFGEFTFDGRSRLLTRNGIERRLSPKALQLLGLLLQERPRALSRKEIYDALWPATFVCETNMAGIVNELRRALGDEARGSNYIRTVHGFGYAFCGEVGETAPERDPMPAAAVLHCEERENPLYEGENVVGRSLDVRVTLMDHTVSRRHAVIKVHDGMISIRDLESTNGTFINGQLLGPGPVTVTAYTRIEFGAAAASITVRRTSSTTPLRSNLAELKRQAQERTSRTRSVSFGVGGLDLVEP